MTTTVRSKLRAISQDTISSVGSLVFVFCVGMLVAFFLVGWISTYLPSAWTP